MAGSILTYFGSQSGVRVAGSESYEGMGVSSESQVSVSDNEITVEDLNCETHNADCTKATGFPTDLGFFIRPMSKEDRLFLISSPPCQPIVENMSGECFPKKFNLVILDRFNHPGIRKRSDREEIYIESG